MPLRGGPGTSDRPRWLVQFVHCRSSSCYWRKLFPHLDRGSHTHHGPRRRRCRPRPRELRGPAERARPDSGGPLHDLRDHAVGGADRSAERRPPRRAAAATDATRCGCLRRQSQTIFLLLTNERGAKQFARSRKFSLWWWLPLPNFVIERGIHLDERARLIAYVFALLATQQPSAVRRTPHLFSLFMLPNYFLKKTQITNDPPTVAPSIEQRAIDLPFFIAAVYGLNAHWCAVDSPLQRPSRLWLLHNVLHARSACRCLFCEAKS